MIYLFSGDDVNKKRKAFEIFQKDFLKLENFNITKNNFDALQTDSFFSGNALFFSKCLVCFENLLEYTEIADFLLKNLEKMQESENIFVFYDGKLNKPVLDIFKKNRAEINIFELTKEKKEKYNNFILADDFANRDKLHLWIHFREAMDLGVGMEELIGILFWKAKDIILKKNFSKFKETELIAFTNKISYLLPKARKEGLDDESVFEQFLLEVF